MAGQNDQLYVSGEGFGSESFVGTRDEFRKALGPLWADWWRDSDGTLSLEDYIEQSLTDNLTPASDDDIQSLSRIAD